MRGKAVPTPFLPRLCLLMYFIVFIWICNTNCDNAFLNLFPRKIALVRTYPWCDTASDDVVIDLAFVGTHVFYVNSNVQFLKVIVVWHTSFSFCDKLLGKIFDDHLPFLQLLYCISKFI